MKIGIVGGTGDIGEGIAMRLSPNHTVVIGSREEDKAVESSAWNVNVYPVCEKFPCEREDFRGSWEDRFSYDYVKEQYDEKLRNVSQEAHTILVSARAHADQEKQQIIKEANDEALRIKKNANEDIERQKRDAQKEMKKAISDVALSAASQLIKKEMDEETQKQFVEDFIEQAGDKQW